MYSIEKAKEVYLTNKKPTYFDIMLNALEKSIDYNIEDASKSGSNHTWLNQSSMMYISVKSLENIVEKDYERIKIFHSYENFLLNKLISMYEKEGYKVTKEGYNDLSFEWGE